MAVYTELGHAEAETLLLSLGLGRLTQLRGVAAGVENSNFFATTARGEWVVTLFERLPAAELPAYLGLMQHLARAGLPVPVPCAASDGALVHHLAGKPAAVVTRLDGRCVESPGPAHCAAVGDFLARMHLCARSFAFDRAHPRGLSWWQQTAPEVLPHMPPDAAALLQTELQHQQAIADSADSQALPRGPIHADLFRDNALFVQHGGTDVLSGVFDFYFAGTGAWVFDLAVCLNDWCIDHTSGRLLEPLAQSLMAAYAAVRPLEPAEQRLLPSMLRAAALRFWLSRWWDAVQPRPAQLLSAKDPAHFERVLRSRIETPWPPVRAARGAACPQPCS